MIGQQIQNYIIISKLGQGGMGTVYKAEDNVLGREVALKMLNTLMINQPQVLERFKKEAQVLARLLHPNIAVIYNLIEQGQQHFMVMEYVEGKNLDEILRQHKTIPYQMVVLIFIQALEGLHHAHKKGIYHRDIKPSNLILAPDGTVKLMDFGIAKVAGEQRMTQVNKVIGTIEYLAPEIIEGKEPSVASDIYAAAVTIYELLAGKLPFESSTEYNLMQDIMKKKPAPPEKYNGDVPKLLSSIVMKALEKKPENRFTDAGEFQQALMKTFPELRRADLGAMNRELESGYAAATQVISLPQREMNNASLQATRLESLTKPTHILQDFWQKYLATTRSRIVAGSVLLLLLLLLGFSIFSGPEKSTAEIAQHTQQEDSLGNKFETNRETNNTGDNIIVPTTTIENTQAPPVSIAQTPVNDQPLRQPEKSDKEKRDQLRKEQEKKDREQQLKEKEQQEEKKIQEDKPVEKRDVYIRSKVEIELSLRDNLGSAPERKDIPVSFTVTRPVVVDGVTIIRQGAIANGVIKLGKIQTDVDINSVTAANGQTVKVRATKGKGRRNTITSDRSYSAFIQPGTRLSF